MRSFIYLSIYRFIVNRCNNVRSVDSLIFGLVRGVGSFVTVLPTFFLVSRMQLDPRYRGNTTSFRSSSSLRREVMVGVVLPRVSTFRVDLGVSGSAVVSGSSAHPSYSCGGWVCDLGVVVSSLIFGLIRGKGFHCGTSDICFSFKNAVRATIPCQYHFLQRNVFFST